MGSRDYLLETKKVCGQHFVHLFQFSYAATAGVLSHSPQHGRLNTLINTVQFPAQRDGMERKVWAGLHCLSLATLSRF